MKTLPCVIVPALLALTELAAQDQTPPQGRPQGNAPSGQWRGPGAGQRPGQGRGSARGGATSFNAAATSSDTSCHWPSAENALSLDESMTVAPQTRKRLAIDKPQPILLINVEEVEQKG